MSLKTIVAGLLIAGAAAPVLAQSDGVSDKSMISKVDAVYVRAGTNLYIEKKLLRKTENMEMWVDVRFASALPDDPQGNLFRVPAEMTVERGDLVSTRIGDETLRSMKLLPQVNEVTRLVAKYDTLMAMAFGLSNARSTHGFFAQSQACFGTTSNQIADAGVYAK